MIGGFNSNRLPQTTLQRLGKIFSISASAAVVVACSGGGSGGPEEPIQADFLVASVPDFYFGTRNVGTSTTQQIELSNRSGDIYPIHRLELVGADAEQFETNFIGELTLQPAERIAIDVTFAPLNDGQKAAQLHVEYDIIKQVTDEENLNEQRFYQAAELEKQGNLEGSAESYKSYLEGKPATINKRKAAIKFPVLSESERHGKGEDFNLYLNAVNDRDESNHLAAITKLNKLIVEEPNSIYADDALYMRGYIQLMDTADYRGARDTMKQLRDQYPDTKYYDTALYSEALANTELGEKKSAGELFQSLKDRHTSEGARKLSLDLPKDNYLSRLWFDRAKQGLSRTADRADLL